MENASGVFYYFSLRGFFIDGSWATAWHVDSAADLTVEDVHWCLQVTLCTMYINSGGPCHGVFSSVQDYSHTLALASINIQLYIEPIYRAYSSIWQTEGEDTWRAVITQLLGHCVFWNEWVNLFICQQQPLRKRSKNGHSCIILWPSKSEKAFSFRGALIPTRGWAPGPRWGLWSQTVRPRCRLALRALAVCSGSSPQLKNPGAATDRVSTVQSTNV